MVQVMAWRRPGDMPLSEPLMVWLPTHICVTRHQWFKWVSSVKNRTFWHVWLFKGDVEGLSRYRIKQWQLYSLWLDISPYTEGNNHVFVSHLHHNTACLKTNTVAAGADRWQSWLNDEHDDVIKWKHFPRYWPFVRGIHRSPVNSPHKGQWRGALLFFHLRLNKRLSKQWWGWWFETPSRPLWRHCNLQWLWGLIGNKHGLTMN